MSLSIPSICLVVGVLGPGTPYDANILTTATLDLLTDAHEVSASFAACGQLGLPWRRVNRLGKPCRSTMSFEDVTLLTTWGP